MSEHVEQFLRDELLETLPGAYDRTALLGARRATYVIHQDVVYEYTAPVTRLRQRLVILPREQHGDQHRVSDRFDVCGGVGSVIERRTDRFGNLVLHIDVAEVRERVAFVARSAVTKTIGCEPSYRCRWPAAALSASRLTRPDAAVAASAAPFRRITDAGRLADELGAFVGEAFSYAHEATTVRTTAAQAWRGRVGVCQDMAHVMISMCTALGVPARYVSGHLVGDGASHAWVEVLDVARGTAIAVDPTHARRTDLRYITTAVGRDYRDVAPTTGTYESEGGSGRLSVHKKIRLVEVV